MNLTRLPLLTADTGQIPRGQVWKKGRSPHGRLRTRVLRDARAHRLVSNGGTQIAQIAMSGDYGQKIEIPETEGAWDDF